MAAKPTEVLRPKSLAEGLQLLELESNPGNPEEVEAAFRKLALAHHPDEGGDPERWLRLQGARGYVQEWLARQEQAAEDPLSKAKGRVPWLGCYRQVCSRHIMKMATCKACLGNGGGHSCKVLSQMSGRFGTEAKAFMVMKISHEEMTEQGAITEWLRKQMIDKEAHKELAKQETRKRRMEREQAELDAFNDSQGIKDAAQEMADDLFEAKHLQHSPAKMQRLAGLGSASEEQIALPSFEQLPYQNCPNCNYEIGYMRDKFREKHIYIFCKKGPQCKWKTVVPLSSMQKPSCSARPCAPAGDSLGPGPSPGPSAAGDSEAKCRSAQALQCL